MGFRPTARKNSTLALGLSAAALTVLLAGQAASADVRWLSGEPVRLDVGFAQPGQLEQDLVALANRPDAKRALVQFDQPVTGAQRNALSDAGVELLHYAGDGVYFATLDADSLDVVSIQNSGVALSAVSAIQPQWKMHPLLINGDIPDYAVTGEVTSAQAGEFASAGEPIVAAYLMLHRDADANAGRAMLENHGVFVVDRMKSVNGFVIEAPMTAIEALAQTDDVLWMEVALPQFSTMNVQNRQLTQVNDVAGSPLNLTGTGVTAFIYDGGRIRSSHNDFEGRASFFDGANQSNHATHVAGTVGAGGPNRGMAPDVTIVSAGFETGGGGGIFLYANPGDFEADYSNAFNNLGADVSNNSIGTNTATNGFPCDITGDYGLMASLIDGAVRGSLTDGRPIRIVWANGNERQSSRCGDLFNTTAPPAGAKNHITVGALNANDDSMTGFSSWGPVDDGRIKPDISAPGCESGGDGGVTSLSSGSDTSYSTLCGTSMAAPTVAGVSALLIEHHRNLFPGSDDPRNSTIKAILAHTAQDLGNTGPDYQFGYGSVRANDAALLMLTRNYTETEVGQDGSATFEVNVEGGGFGQFQATIAWDDAPAIPNVDTALVNDVDLVITDPNGVRHYPWTLDPASPGSPAIQTQEDHVNNIEQVSVLNAVPGIWTVEVRGTNVPEGSQPVSVVTSGELIGMSAAVVGGLPELVSPTDPTTLNLNVIATGQDVLENSVKLFYRLNGTEFTSVTMSQTGPFTYTADLPPAFCDSPAEFYFSAKGSITSEFLLPTQGAAAPYSVNAGSIDTVLEDDLSTDEGWTVGAPGDDATTGIWERVDPVGTGAQPDGALFGEFCFVTGQHPGGGDGANDIDGGQTTLTSPMYDLSGYNAGDLTFSYWRWYSNSAGASPNADVFVIDISDDGGATWTNLETVGPDGGQVNGGWFQNVFDPADFVSLTDSVMLRFIASDEGDGSLVEAAIDGLRVDAETCVDGSPDCPGDVNGSLSVDLADLNLVLASFGQTTDQGDTNGDGVVDLADLNTVLGAFGNTCE